MLPCCCGTTRLFAYIPHGLVQPVFFGVLRRVRVLRLLGHILQRTLKVVLHLHPRILLCWAIQVVLLLLPGTQDWFRG